MNQRYTRVFIFICSLFPLLLSHSAWALNEADHDYDKYNGDEINQVCAGCHDEFGMGGKDGKYPRLAGLPVPYLYKEMIAFRDRTRPNMAMVEHVDDRQMPEEDLMDIAIFLSRIQLSSKLSVVDETASDFDAYARLQEAKSTIQIGRAAGDLKKGARLYKNECRSCHGRDGMGDDELTPPIAGQYTEYLWKQIELYRKTLRTHDPDDPSEEYFNSFSDQELQDIFAFASTLDD